MDDAVMKRLRADRDKVERAAAAKEAEREERLAQTKAKGRAAGEVWVRNSAAYEPLKQLAAGSSDAIEKEVWLPLRSEGIVTEQEWRERAKAAAMLAYQAAFIGAVNEALQHVNADR